MKAVALALAVAVGCGGSKPAEPSGPPHAEGGGPRAIVAGMPDAPWTLVYADGSANVYKVWSDDGARTAFDYDPVTPAESSTGMYSGGEPRKGEVAADQLATLWERVHEFETDTAHHTTERGKGTGAFTITDPSGERTFIVDRTPALVAFDELLAGWH